jgi:S1-C subfamily serine protease
MPLARRLRPRVALLGLVAILAVGAGLALANARASERPLGTGVVIIETNLGLQGGAAAGTGMVLTPFGEVLTNHHVIAGATRIRVEVPSSGRSYAARVVGYDTQSDVAVLQLRDASGLQTVRTGDASALGVGDRVTAVGNANGTGTLVAARGTVTGLNRSITAQDDNGAERLSGLIETDADLQPGDSGGPLLNGDRKVVGMDTAASAGPAFTAYDARESSGDGFAIPIGKALAIAHQITSGRSSASVHIGGTALLGVQLAGTTVAGVVPGGPADAAGLVPGDVITSIGGRAVSAAGDVQSAVLARAPGTRTQVGYLDELGTPQTVTVTLGSGPPQ